MNIICLILTLLIAASTALAGSLLDIQSIAGKTQKEVQVILGTPSSSDETKNGLRWTYDGDGVEVIFINGKADWITITPQIAVPFNKQALTSLGLREIEPTFSNANVIRWEPCGKYTSVAIFPANDKVFYAYIKVSTK